MHSILLLCHFGGISITMGPAQCHCCVLRIEQEITVPAPCEGRTLDSLHALALFLNISLDMRRKPHIVSLRLDNQAVSMSIVLLAAGANCVIVCQFGKAP